MDGKRNNKDSEDLKRSGEDEAPLTPKTRKALAKKAKSKQKIQFASEKTEIAIPYGSSQGSIDDLNGGSPSTGSRIERATITTTPVLPDEEEEQEKMQPSSPGQSMIYAEDPRLQSRVDEGPRLRSIMKMPTAPDVPDLSRDPSMLEITPPLQRNKPSENGHTMKTYLEKPPPDFKYDDKEAKRFESMHQNVIDISPYAGYFCQNIDKFFKYNKNNLVRPKIKVEEMEQKKARSWVFFLVIIQITICVIYVGLVMQLPRFYVNLAFAGILGVYVIIKIFAVLLFVLRRGSKNFKCCSSYDATDPEQAKLAKEIFICIPAYNEERAAFENTVGSICASNYPKEKLYMLFIIDGNKGNTFQNVMELLLDGPYPDAVPAGKRILKHGVYQGIPYSVFLKEENRGKRDSQWLFVELLRNMIPEYSPEYVFFVDSDTAFEPDSIRYLCEDLDADHEKKIAGVCGKLTLSNFGKLDKKLDNSLYFLSTMFIVGFQYFEYHFNQIIGKQAEAAFDSVSCLPGAFSMFRANLLTGVEARIAPKTETELQELPSVMVKNMTSFSLYYYQIKQQLPLILDDFFSKETVGIVDRNLYELGEDRTLTVRFLEQGYRCLYEPRAVALTECPDSIVKFIQQRRRWNNSTFVNLAAMMTRKSLWLQAKTFPIMIFSLFDLCGSYLMPANSLILSWIIWTPLFNWISAHINYTINGLEFIVWWTGLQMMMISVTNCDDRGGMLYVLITFFSGLLMLGSAWFFVFDFMKPIIDKFINEPAPLENSAPVFMLFLFPLLYIIMSITYLPAVFTVVFYYLMIPVISLTLPFYSFLHLDDFSWGNR